MTDQPIVVVHPDGDLLARATAARFLLTVIDAQSVTTPVHVALTGGSILVNVLRAIAEDPLREAVDWSNVHIWWGDERFVPAGDGDRNEVQAREALLDFLVAECGLPEENIHVMAGPGTNGIETADQSAKAYNEELAAFAPEGKSAPEFDLLLLGMGPDIHVASLFPGHAGLEVTGVAATGVQDSPKPPPTRVSLTFEAINQAKRVWIVAGGAEKADAVRAVLNNSPIAEAPAAGVAGTQETLLLLDAASAS